MKVNKLIALAVLALMVLPCGIVLAETVEGNVASVDLDGNKLEVTTKNAQTGAEEKVAVSVSDTTVFSGDAASLAEVVEGDIAKLEVEKDTASGSSVAKSVEITIPEEEGAAI
ncbi:MAG: hypothetical protein HYU34_05620 [Candidatus Omnitrophica bacterium]|nr:hypothetical protein [Candidatus Omnitrophota bacterium]